MTKRGAWMWDEEIDTSSKSIEEWIGELMYVEEGLWWQIMPWWRSDTSDIIGFKLIVKRSNIHGGHNNEFFGKTIEQACVKALDWLSK